MRSLIYIPILFIILSLNSCCTLKKCPYKDIETYDSTYVREVINYRDSTIYYTITDSVVVNITKDTISTIDTDIAVSIAKVSDGLLYHELRNKQGLVPVNVSIPETVITENKTQTITRTVEVEKELTKWQKIRITLGDALIAIAIGLIVAFVIKLFVKRI